MRCGDNVMVKNINAATIKAEYKGTNSLLHFHEHIKASS